jgi:tetratricopeptide (TPR) repeat protein
MRKNQLRADYKIIAKALGRIGSAYYKKGDLASAIKNYEKSLAEHRTPDILNKLREIERAKVEADRKAYIDPEQSAVAREEGNKLFKDGDFVGAVKNYTESIMRDPSDARGYNNRAAAYIKLVALPEALKDVDQAIMIDPKFGALSLYIAFSRLLTRVAFPQSRLTFGNPTFFLPCETTQKQLKLSKRPRSMTRNINTNRRFNSKYTNASRPFSASGQEKAKKRRYSVL